MKKDSKAPKSKRPSKAKVLVVEDNPDHLELAVTILEYANYRVFRACSGEEAVALAQKEVPDLIFMDIRLPEMDGFESIRRLRKDPKTAEAGIIVLSAYADENNRKKAEEAGCDGFVSKPLTPYFLESEFVRVMKKRNKKRNWLFLPR